MNNFISILIIVSVALMTLPARAQTPIGNDAANTYYGNCVAKRDERMTEKTQEGLCACTAAKMMETMDAEDIQIMAQNNEAGRAKLNFMLLNVYAPCIQFPASDLVVGECMKDEKISMLNLKMDRATLCGCMGAHAGEWLASAGRDILARLLKNDPNITDPISPVMDSPEFRKASFEIMTLCMNEGP